MPTQVHKLLEAAEASPALGSEIYDALGQFTGILLGGAPASASLLTAARELGLNVVTTYGSAETAGGCVYSGTALPGGAAACGSRGSGFSRQPGCGRG